MPLLCHNALNNVPSPNLLPYDYISLARRRPPRRAAVGVAHRVAAEVVEVFAHTFHKVGGFATVGVEGEVGVGVEDHGGVGLVARGAGGFQLAQHLLGTLVVAVGDELAHIVVLSLQLVGHDEQPEAAQLRGVGLHILQHIVDEAALLHIVLAGGDFVVLDDLQQRLGVLCGLGDGELGVGLDGVAQRGVELVALLVGLLEGGGVVAGAVPLEGRVLLLESRAELFDGALPEFVLQTDFLGALAHGDEVLIMRRVGRPRDADGFNLVG